MTASSVGAFLCSIVDPSFLCTRAENLIQGAMCTAACVSWLGGRDTLHCVASLLRRQVTMHAPVLSKAFRIAMCGIPQRLGLVSCAIQRSRALACLTDMPRGILAEFSTSGMDMMPPHAIPLGNPAQSGSFGCHAKRHDVEPKLASGLPACVPSSRMTRSRS